MQERHLTNALMRYPLNMLGEVFCSYFFPARYFFNFQQSL